MSETSGEKRKGALASEFGRKLHEVARWAIIEGLIDPNDGTEFELMQFDLTEGRLDPITFTFQGPKKFVVNFGIPNPIEQEFDQLVLSDEERKAKQDRIQRELEEQFPELREDGEE